MGFTRRVGWVLILGSAVFAVVGLIHVAGSVRVGGADGFRWPGWAVLVVAPLVAFVGWVLAQVGRLIEERRAGRRRPRSPAPWVTRLFARWR